MENQFGKVSKLNLTAAYKDGKTILEDVFFTAPFKIMRPFYEKKGVMTVMLMTASAGIMAGDCQEFDIRVKEGANMEFVSQAYEKIHKMDEGCAQRRSVITVEENAQLRYTPLPTIPFAKSDYRSTLRVDLAGESSKFVYSEVLSCGRSAHGEEFLYTGFCNNVSVYQKGKIIYRDNTRYRPDKTDMRGFGMYEGFTHLANLLIFNEDCSDEWLGSIRTLMDDAPDLEGGASRIVNGDIAVRMLGTSAQKLTDMMGKILKAAEI